MKIRPKQENNTKSTRKTSDSLLIKIQVISFVQCTQTKSDMYSRVGLRKQKNTVKSENMFCSVILILRSSQLLEIRKMVKNRFEFVKKCLPKI